MVDGESTDKAADNIYDIRHRCNPGCNSLQFFTKFKVDMFRGRIPGLKWYTLY
ncbi:hypothetical protein F9C07_993 [Aspergillus flavus]|uniref:Uncharacterized protein n=1 Tax=Aspergillus flavus (strain ATCC 200026 / FGSC A1120 / IAM 13836 / NRRL 3357 / JCM 12722 / SRRC 167) TaxID=332952 RepID=A0A7U2MR65_ASPFN|nr:hypothetical protein F9C07_993 [Aspergillus flavus]